MYWQEKESNELYKVPDDVVDVAYRIACKCLPLEHAHALSAALHDALPWLAEEEGAGVHLIHGAESGNGWVRPEDPENQVLHLSRRTRLTLRLPKGRLDAAQKLTGAKLDIAGYALEVGEGTVRPLSTATTIFARYVIAESEDEQAFMASVAAELKGMGVGVRKFLCGRSHLLDTPDGKLLTRSVMLADLEVEQSVRLQQRGLGAGRKMGCGLFIPHKGIAPIKSLDNE